MKTKILLLMLVLATCVGLSSCSENKIAKDNIKQYIIDKYLNDAEIVEEAYSELYISRTTNEEELQTIFLESIENKSMGERGYATSKYLTTSPSGIAIRLMTTGCSRSVIEDIIRNDADFNKANYEAKEYFMIAFFTISKEYKTEKVTLLFSLTPNFNILETHKIPAEDSDYIYIRTIGPNSDCFNRAVDCEYNYLINEYNKYVDILEDTTYYLGVDSQYEYLKDLNSLFGYEKYKITSNKDIAVQECIKKLDWLDDKIELRDIASENIKALN